MSTKCSTYSICHTAMGSTRQTHWYGTNREQEVEKNNELVSPSHTRSHGEFLLSGTLPNPLVKTAGDPLLPGTGHVQHALARPPRRKTVMSRLHGHSEQLTPPRCQYRPATMLLLFLSALQDTLVLPTREKPMIPKRESGDYSPSEYDLADDGDVQMNSSTPPSHHLPRRLRHRRLRRAGDGGGDGLQPGRFQATHPRLHQHLLCTRGGLAVEGRRWRARHAACVT